MKIIKMMGFIDSFRVMLNHFMSGKSSTAHGSKVQGFKGAKEIASTLLGSSVERIILEGNVTIGLAGWLALIKGTNGIYI